MPYMLMMYGHGERYSEILYSLRKLFSLVVFFRKNFSAILVPVEMERISIQQCCNDTVSNRKANEIF